jgi:hypothetical protein
MKVVAEFRYRCQGERLGSLLAGTGAGVAAELILFIANRRNREQVHYAATR